MMYKYFKAVFFAALTMAINTSIASAQASGLDGKANIYNSYWALKYIEHSKNPDFVHGEAAIRSLIDFMLADHKLTAWDKDLINELNRTDVTTIELNLRGNKYPIPTANAEGRRILNLLIDTPNLEDYWGATPENLAKMAELYSLSNLHRDTIKRFIAGKMLPAWQSSNISDNYEPFREALGPIIQTSKNINSPEDHRAVLIMMHGASEYLDQHLKGTMPDYLYHWIKPLP